MCVCVCVCVCVDKVTMPYKVHPLNQFSLFRSVVKPEESQYTEMELTDNPSYQTVGGKPHKQGGVYESVDTYY